MINFDDTSKTREEWLIDEIDWYINDSPNSAQFRNNLRSIGSTKADDDEFLKKSILDMFKQGELRLIYDPLEDKYCFGLLVKPGHYKEI